jgi:hypothetical protein
MLMVEISGSAEVVGDREILAMEAGFCWAGAFG